MYIFKELKLKFIIIRNNKTVKIANIPIVKKQSPTLLVKKADKELSNISGFHRLYIY